MQYDEELPGCYGHGSTLCKPDFFITFTCNSNWPEIVESIHPWETPNNGPDIVVRVFHAKVQELLRLHNAVQMFESVLSFLYVMSSKNVVFLTAICS